MIRKIKYIFKLAKKNRSANCPTPLPAIIVIEGSALG
jgi:hypothetical protein